MSGANLPAWILQTLKELNSKYISSFHSKKQQETQKAEWWWYGYVKT